MKPLSTVTFMMMFVALVIPSSVSAAPINLSFSGLVDSSGATVGGVDAPVGSAFTLDLVIDDALAASGVYAIQSLGYSTTVGTYNTVTAWGPLTAAGSGAGMTLTRAFQQPGEHLEINLTNFGVGSVFNNPLTWNGAGISGDILVRGLGGLSSLDQLSGESKSIVTLAVSVSPAPIPTPNPAPIPAPSAMLLLGTGLIGLTTWRFRAKNRH